jgi:hypothetical protein
MSDVKERCVNCRFYKDEGYDAVRRMSLHYCRLEPPKLVSRDFYEQAITRPNGWCRLWEPASNDLGRMIRLEFALSKGMRTEDAWAASAAELDGVMPTKVISVPLMTPDGKPFVMGES